MTGELHRAAEVAFASIMWCLKVVWLADAASDDYEELAFSIGATFGGHCVAASSLGSCVGSTG